MSHRTKGDSPARKQQKVYEDESSSIFRWLISPTTTETFYSKHWEKSPLIIHRNQADYYKTNYPMFTLDDLKKQLKEQKMIYGVVSFKKYKPFKYFSQLFNYY